MKLNSDSHFETTQVPRVDLQAQADGEGTPKAVEFASTLLSSVILGS